MTWCDRKSEIHLYILIAVGGGEGTGMQHFRSMMGGVRCSSAPVLVHDLKHEKDLGWMRDSYWECGNKKI